LRVRTAGAAAPRVSEGGRDRFNRCPAVGSAPGPSTATRVGHRRI